MCLSSRCGRGHSRAASLGNADPHKGLRPPESKSSIKCRKQLVNKILDYLYCFSFSVNTWADSMKVQIIKAHHNWIAVAYSHFVTGYR